ncbi:hypothetical protein QBC38DRAFT_469918 [Podospora fimiseda]|uniref:Uncharacterized protein n=1 Tax=Podospora fimiseda TaxID=252190 RepID=A0AAN7BVE0_9PEZI|nr:hypothetical protein QBC38DRAFT_469918 [Podospora fimiseda]
MMIFLLFGSSSPCETVGFLRALVSSGGFSCRFFWGFGIFGVIWGLSCGLWDLWFSGGFCVGFSWGFSVGFGIFWYLLGGILSGSVGNFWAFFLIFCSFVLLFSLRE